jgi:hypothetical protein
LPFEPSGIFIRRHSLKDIARSKERKEVKNSGGSNLSERGDKERKRELLAKEAMALVATGVGGQEVGIY